MKPLKGQALPYLLVVIPVVILLGGLAAREGTTLLIHQRLQNHCNEKALNMAAEQADGLRALGKLNPVSRRVIDLRRKIDRALAAGTVSPAAMPVLVSAEQSLRGIQEMIAGKQKMIITSSLTKSLAVANRPFRSFTQEGLRRGSESEAFTPSDLTAPHRSKKALRLHIKDEMGYVSEVGAPQTLDADFDGRQHVAGQIHVETESFLEHWPGFKMSSAMTINCEAKVNMNGLEDKWSVTLTPAVKASSKAL